MALYTRTWGAGPELLLIHGWGLHSEVWDGFAEELAAEFRVTVVDLPGHGRSPPQGVFSLHDAAAAVLAAAPAKALWLGWSLGGMVALEAAACRPQRVSRLVLMASNPRFVAAPDWPGMDAAVLERFAADLAEDYRATLQRFLALVARGADSEAGGLRALRRRFAAGEPPDADALQAGLQILRDTDLRPELGRLAMPTLAVLGERDMLVPAAVGPLLAQLLGPGRVQTVAGAGHAPFLSDPARCASLLREFMS